MGHWDASTLGSDGAWDAIASFVSMWDTMEIRGALLEAFSPPSSGEHYDEGEAPYVLAIAELVAAAFGEPSRWLPEKAPKWVKRHAWSLSGYREQAIAAVELARGSPYGEMWVREEGAAEFQDACGDLLERLRRGTPPRWPTAKARFFRRLAERALQQGWRTRASQGEIFRPREDGGEDRVKFWPNGKHGLWTATLTFAVAYPELQELVWGQTDHAKFGPRSAVVRTFPPPDVYPGKTRHLTLYEPGVDVPPKAELDAKGLRPADVLNPDETVFAAAERGLEIVEEHAEPWFEQWASKDTLRPIAERGDLQEIGQLASGAAAKNWIAIAWDVSPDLGRALYQKFRDQAEKRTGRIRDEELALLDQIEAAMASWPQA